MKKKTVKRLLSASMVTVMTVGLLVDAEAAAEAMTAKAEAAMARH